jgi:hypothetical protein
MNPKKNLYKCTPLLLSVVAGLSGVVYAEDFSLDSASKGQTTQTVQSGASSVTGVNSTAVQGSLTDTAFLDNDGEGVSRLAFVGDEKWKDEIFLFTGRPMRQMAIEFFTQDQFGQAQAWLSEEILPIR